MNLYLISQDVIIDYDTYDSAVVVARNRQEAQKMSPSGDGFSGGYGWCSWEDVKVKLIGVACKKYKKPCVICASFNAG
jgi:hypothetical protein